MLNFYQIAKNTFRECLREPIFFILLLSALTLIGLFPSMCLFVFREQIKLVIDSSMATTLVFGLLAAVLCASHTVAREMRNGTVLLLMSKPVRRWSFVIAKIGGIALALIVFVLICNCASLISLKIAKDQFQLNYTMMTVYFMLLVIATVIGGIRNFHSQASFSAGAIVAVLIMVPLMALICYLMPNDPHDDAALSLLNLSKAQILLFFSVCTMGVITVTLSTRLDMIPNLTVSAAIFFLGLLSGYLCGLDTGNVFINSMTGLLYLVLPNWQFFWLADALAANQPIPFAYMVWATVNAVFYMALCSIWAVALFQDREMAKDIR